MTLKISLKLTFLSLGLVVFTGLLLFHFANRETQLALRRQILSDLIGTTDFYMTNISEFNYHRINELEILADDYLVQQYVSYPDSLNKRLQHFQQLHEIYYSFSFYDTSRRKIADSRLHNIGETHQGDGIWAKVILNPDAEYVIHVGYDNETNTNVAFYATYVKDKFSAKVGLLVAKVQLEQINKILTIKQIKNIDGSPLILTDSIKVHLVDSLNTIIYSNLYPTGTSLNKYQEATAIKEIQKASERIFESKSDLYFYAREENYHNYNSQGWQIITSIPVQVAFRPMLEIRRKLTFTIVIVLIVAGVVGYLTSRRFSRPIRRLARAADQVASGNFDAPIEVETHDEIGYLARHFKVMAANVKKRIREVQIQKAQIERQNKALEKAYQELDYKNKQTLASINYAKKIQASMMPDVAKLTQYFEDSFALYLPKDIVSGDIYWFDTVKDENGLTKVVIAAMDCTGHGVPGAIMSILGSNLITNIVSYGKILNLAEVLSILNLNIIQVLHQAETPENSQDGMEIALISFDVKSQRLEFAGCGRPLWVVRNGELHEIEPNKITVGGINKLAMKHGGKATDFEVEVHSLQLVKGDCIYLFSDGYKDQIGTDRKRFSNRKLKEVLLEINALPMHEQQERLQSTLIAWQGSEKQTDDILVIGLRV